MYLFMPHTYLRAILLPHVIAPHCGRSDSTMWVCTVCCPRGQGQGQHQIFTTADRANSPFLWKPHTQHEKLLSKGQTLFRGKNIVCLGELIKLERPFPVCCCQRGCSALFCHNDLGLLSNVHGLQYLLPHRPKRSIWGLGVPASLIDALWRWILVKLLMRFDWDSHEPTVRQDGERICETFGLMQTRTWISPLHESFFLP